MRTFRLPKGDEWLNVRQVADVMGYHPQSIWKLLRNDPTFPKPCRFSPRKVFWRRSAIVARMNGEQVEPEVVGQ